MTTIAQEGKKVNAMEYHRSHYSVGEHARKSDTVYIVGMAGSASLVPTLDDDDDGAEVWRINEAYRVDEHFGRETKATRWFQLHQRWDFTRRQNANQAGIDHWTWLRQEHPFQIYMIQRWDDIPNSVAFPIDLIVGDLIGEGVGRDFNFDFFRNSLAYQLAFAIWLGFKRVGIYGWELASDTEMKYERPSATFWLGWLAALIGPKNIDIPIGSLLLAGGTRRYAYDDVPAINRMHIESALGSVKNLEYRIQADLRRNPTDQVARYELSYFVGQRVAYEKLMAELDDVSDPRGTFDHEEESVTKEADTSEIAELRASDLQD